MRWPSFFLRPADTIVINGHRVPEPMRQAPEHGAEYWIGDLCSDPPASSQVWRGDNLDKRYLRRGLAQATRSGAVAYATAVLSITQRGGE